MVVVPPDAERGEPTRVLINSVHDNPLHEHLESLVANAGTLLETALENPKVPHNESGLIDLLVRHRIREKTVFIANVNRTVQTIRQERRLREVVRDFVDSHVTQKLWTARTPAETFRRQIRHYCINAYTDKDIPRKPTPGLEAKARLFRLLDLIFTFAVFPIIGILSWAIAPAIRLIENTALRILTWLAYAVWWLWGAIPSGLSLLGVRFIEVIESDNPAQASNEDAVQRLEAHEDRYPTNKITIWFAVKPNWIRPLLLRSVLFGSERGSRHFWTHGDLGGIDTIHYARFLQLDRGKTMVFMTDYEGGLSRYLGDFLDVGSRAVIPISSNCAGCPKTRWLYQKQDPVRFGGRWIGMIRQHQLDAAVWYNAYAILTPREIRANAKLRDGLFADILSEVDARRWARMI